MSGLLSEATSFVSSNIPSMSSITTGISSAVSGAVSSLLNPTGPIPLSATSNVAKGYLVTFKGFDELGNPIGFYYPGGAPPKGSPGIIRAFLPEMFDIGTYSHFQSLAPSGDLVKFLNQLNQGVGSPLSLVNKGLTLAQAVSPVGQALTGYTTQIPALSMQLWQASDPLTFNLNLQLNAVVDAKAEVTGMVTSLLSLTLPSVDEVGTFRAPGPSIVQGGQYASQYNISMSIGGNWLFPNVIITQVSASFDVLPTVKGDYISATVHVVVQTDRIYSKQDLNAAMNNSPTATTSNAPGGITVLGQTLSGAEKYVSGAASSAVSSVGNFLSNTF
jgi:hypothetical protein